MFTLDKDGLELLMAKTLVVGDIHLKAFDILAKVNDVLSKDGEIERVYVKANC